MKSCSTSDFLLSKSWHDTLDISLPSLVTALDIAGAFDCVWHRGLTVKLQQLGVTGDLLILLSSYLMGRDLRVVENGHTAGFPLQASVLGHILWNIYPDDLLHSTTAATQSAGNCTLLLICEREEA